ncbi:MAG: hypothetical protein ABI569_15125, partial [Casimicrobiaceae bacterium]
MSAGLALALSSSTALAATVLYGGLGGLGLAGGSTNDGSLVIIGQTNASIQVVGHPANVGRLSGLAFALDGTLYGATQGAGGGPPPPADPSNLIRIDPATGALLASVPIHDGQSNIAIADLAVQPGTGILFGIRREDSGGGVAGRLYTIDTNTGLATLRGSTGAFAASITFAPDGTLYLSSRNMIDTVHTFKRIDPATAATLSSVVTLYFFGGLAVRPSDGVIFGSLGNTGELHTIDAATGVSTLVGKTGTNYPGALAFGTGPDSSNYQGLWWKAPGGSEDGWGINFAHQGNVIFGTWFTYDTTGKGWWLTLITDTNLSPGVFTAKLYATTGPPFDSVPFIKTGPPPPAIG